MTEGQQRGWDEGFPALGSRLEDGPFDWESTFANPGPRIVEIGFGMGDSLISMAQAHPEHCYLGIEVHRPGVGRLLSRAMELGIENLHVYADDAVQVLEACLMPGSLDGIQIYFPDPWHKKRHHKRRLIQEQFLELIHPKLKQDGYLHIATDWEGYAEWIIDMIKESKHFEFSSDDFFKKPDYRANTKYESRGIRLGHKVWDFLIRKR